MYLYGEILLDLAPKTFDMMPTDEPINSGTCGDFEPDDIWCFSVGGQRG